MNTLYIVGNGFDLYHGIKSSYGDFKEWLKNIYYEDYKSVKYFDNKCFFSEKLKKNWSNIENALCIEISKNSFPTSFVNPSWHFTEKKARNYSNIDIISILSTVFNIHFREWVYELDNNIKRSHIKKSSEFNFDKNDYFISFNYIRTLEKIYGIPAFQNNETPRIIYIHNKITDDCSLFCDSHDQTNCFVFGNKDNIKLSSLEIFGNYYDMFSKNTEKCWRKYSKYIESLKDIKIIKIYGHSFDLQNGDMDYFNQLANIYPNIPWELSYYDNEDKKRKEVTLQSFCKKNASIKIDLFKF